MKCPREYDREGENIEKIYSRFRFSPIFFYSFLIQSFAYDDQDGLSIWNRRNLGLLVGDVDGYPASISEFLKAFNSEDLTTGWIVQDFLAAFFLRNLL